MFGTGLSYHQYLQAKSFVDDVSYAGRRVVMEMSRQTRRVLASNEALGRHNTEVIRSTGAAVADAVNESSRQTARNLSDGIDRMASDILDAIAGSGEAISQSVETAAENVTGELARGFEGISQHIDASSERLASVLEGGFEQLAYRLDAVSDELQELDSTFHWGFGEVIAELGHMRDSLSDLVRIANTPVQTVAFNHFEIARDAFRRRLYRECFEELQKAIEGDHTSPGYKLEWRFHQMIGTLRLGFVDGDLDLVDLEEARKSFLLAARYARSDYPREAAAALFSAGWAAYCEGQIEDALTHTRQALAIQPGLGEALFQLAKLLMANREPEPALKALQRAIEIDPGYALKAAVDGDFQRFDDELRALLDWIRAENCRLWMRGAEEKLTEIEELRPDATDVFSDPDAQSLREFLQTAQQLPLLDLLHSIGDHGGVHDAYWNLSSTTDALRALVERAQTVLSQTESTLHRYPELVGEPALDVLGAIAAKRGSWADAGVAAVAQALDAAIGTIAGRSKEVDDALHFIRDALAEESTWRGTHPDLDGDPDFNAMRSFVAAHDDAPQVQIERAADPSMHPETCSTESAAAALANLRRRLSRIPMAREALSWTRFWQEHDPELAADPDFRLVQEFATTATTPTRPFANVFEQTVAVDEAVAALRRRLQEVRAIVSHRPFSSSCEDEELYEGDETYAEVVSDRRWIVKTTRTVSKTRRILLKRKVARDVEVLRDDILANPGTLLARLEFRQVFPGEVLIGDTMRVSLTRPFYIAATPLTYEQWRSVVPAPGERIAAMKDTSEAPSTVYLGSLAHFGWAACLDFIARLNRLARGARYHLPTEAEWLRASGSTYAFSRFEFHTGIVTSEDSQRLTPKTFEWTADAYRDLPATATSRRENADSPPPSPALEGMPANRVGRTVFDDKRASIGPDPTDRPGAPNDLALLRLVRSK